MHCFLLAALSLLSADLARARVLPRANKKVQISNDDGWATAQVREQYNQLKASYDVIISAPAENQSGKGSEEEEPQTLSEPCEFDTCPAGSPPEGADPNDDHINYVNGFPVDAARFGIQTTAPKILGGKPDLVVSGPNIGNNLNIINQFSGTVGAASEAAKEGIPSIAVSAKSGAQVSYTTLQNTSDPNTIAAQIYSTLTKKLVDTILSSSASPLLPPNVSLNVNYPGTDDCSSADAFRFVMTRIVGNPFATDVETCGSDHLPDETVTVALEGKKCYASVSAFDANSKLDVDRDTQAKVLAVIQPVLSCKD